MTQDMFASPGNTLLERTPHSDQRSENNKITDNLTRGQSPCEIKTGLRLVVTLLLMMVWGVSETVKNCNQFYLCAR